MKKLTSIALSALLAASMTAMSVLAQEDATAVDAAEVDTSNVVQVNVMDGLCTLIDNPATNHQASNYALCFAEAYGTGRTTEDDAVVWEGVTFDKDVKQVAIKCGYNLGGDKAGTSTQFWLYLNKIEGEPIAKVEVSDAETASSQIKDQVLKFADVNVTAGTYDVIVVGKTEYSGSVSQINFMYEAMDEAALVPVADALKAADSEKALVVKKAKSAKELQSKKYGYINVNVKEGECELIDNPATNHQASNYALCFAAAYGTGRTTEDDAVVWENVYIPADVKKVAIKCGYNLGGDKAGTSTQFWLYLDKIEGEPIAKVEVSDSETKSSQIVDQVLKLADVDIKAGTYDVIVVGKTEYSGSVSQINFITDSENITDVATLQAALDKEAADIKAEEEKKAAEEKAKAEAKAKEDEAKEDEAKEDEAKEDEAKEDEAKEDEAKEDEAKEDEAKEDEAKEDEAKEDEAKDTENTPAPEDNNTEDGGNNTEDGGNNTLPIVIIIAVVAVVVIGGVVIAKKKKQ